MSILGSLGKVASNIANLGVGFAQALTGRFQALPSKKGSPKDIQPIDVDAVTKSTTVLGLIYSTMVRAREEELAERTQAEKDRKDQKDLDDTRNEELIKALTVRRKPKKKIPKKSPDEKKVKQEEKKQESKKNTEEKKDERKKQTDEKKSEQEQKKQTSERKKEEAKPIKKKKAEEVKPEVKKPEAEKVKEAPPKEVKAPQKVTPSKPGVAPKISSEQDIKNMVIMNEGKGLPGKPGQPYQDSMGLWTIGVGHLIQKRDEKLTKEQFAEKYPQWNRTLSDDEINKLFEEDYVKHKNLAKKFPNFDKFNLNGQAALIDLAFNVPIALTWPVFNKQLAEMDVEGAAKNLEGTKWYTQVASRAPRTVALLRNGVGNETTNKQMTLPPTLNSGTQIDQMSKENKDMKSAAELKSKTNVNTTNVTAAKGSSTQTVTQEEVDDRRPMDKK